MAGFRAQREKIQDELEYHVVPEIKEVLKR